MHHLPQTIAILREVVATSALKAADGFRVPLPSVLVLVGYTAAFHFLSVTLRSIPAGIAYAIWSGIGRVLCMRIARLTYGQTLDAPAFAGIALVVAGVRVLILYSSSMPH